MGSSKPGSSSLQILFFSRTWFLISGIAEYFSFQTHSVTIFNSDEIDKIKQLARTFHPDIVSCRRHLQCIRNLKLKRRNLLNRNYANTVLIILNEWRIRVLLLWLKEKNPASKVVALRADMDLYLFRKQIIPLMFPKRWSDACMWSWCTYFFFLLGVARILNSVQEDFEGTKEIYFQPGEEKLPGRASMMIKEGVLSNPAPQAVIGQHVMPQIKGRKIGFRKGLYMASTDEIYVKVKGQRRTWSHAHLTVDPVMITAQILVALQQIVNRTAKPSMHALYWALVKWLRMVPPMWYRMKYILKELFEHWMKNGGMKHTTKWKRWRRDCGKHEWLMWIYHCSRLSVLINDEVLTDRIRSYAGEYVGEENIEDLEIWMAAEDFAFHNRLRHVLQVGRKEWRRELSLRSIHPTFDADESALETGMGLMAWMTLRELQSW